MTAADLSLVTNNCTTVFVYHLLPDILGREYQTPWIGMQIPDDAEFLRLCLNYADYMEMQPTFGQRRYPCLSSQIDSPCMHLGDVEVHWLHETDEGEALEKYLRRRDRAAGKLPFFFWSDYQSYQNRTEADREAMIAQFLSLPEAQRVFFRKEDVPEWCDQSFQNRTLVGVHANILGWPHGHLIDNLVADHLQHYGE